MQRKNRILKPSLSALLVAGLWANLVWAQTALWNRIPLDGSGVSHNLVITYRDDGGDAKDHLWMAGAGNGLFRSIWNAGGYWNDWTEYSAGMGFRGVDAIEVSLTEYVLGARPGIRYSSASYTGGWPGLLASRVYYNMIAPSKP